MTSPASAPSVSVGKQEPRFCTWPDAVGSAGAEAVDLARAAGLELDPWQELVLAHSLGERSDGKWAAFEVGLIVPRQNGKGAILEARELAGLFLLGERLIIHAAHEFATSLEAFHRLKALIEGSEEFSAQVKRVSSAHGEEGVELTSGQRIRFRTRTKGGGRGFSCDCLILDEAMDIPHKAHGALLPTLSARPNPQVWYTGSAVDREIHDNGLVFAHVRERGIAGDAGLAFFEWSADAELDTVYEIADTEEAWAGANPGMGLRVRASHIALERRAMDPRTFAVERLGVGDWPSLEGDDEDGITRERFKACEDQSSGIVGAPRYALDVRPDRSAAAIGVAGVRADGLPHIEVIEHLSGVRWVVDRLVEIVERHGGKVIYDEKSPAAALAPMLDERGVDLESVNGSEYAQACGLLFDDFEQGTVRHLGTPELAAAVRGAAKRPLGDAWAWSRKTSAVDISPLVACTLARWGMSGDRPSVYETRGVLTV